MKEKTGSLKKNAVYAFLLFAAVCVVITSCVYSGAASQTAGEAKDYVTYAEFNVPYAALDRALQYDIEAHEANQNYGWIELLSILAARYYGEFSGYRASDLDAVAEELKNGSSVEAVTKELKLYSYYHEVYSAVLGGLVGEFEQETENGTVQKYGLKAFSPIAKNFGYEHYDDFGAQRTYGYARRHLGHDLIAEIGTPVIAVESGVVECLGWNQYGGWRIGIRSFDGKRYYYYAHLRQNCPYAADLKEGNQVCAGDVIGYVGHTGYSTKENVNNIEVSHLHFGLELVFDESQKESDNEIWVDLYALTQLLSRHRSEVYRDAQTKEFYRKYKMTELS